MMVKLLSMVGLALVLAVSPVTGKEKHPMPTPKILEASDRMPIPAGYLSCDMTTVLHTFWPTTEEAMNSDHTLQSMSTDGTFFLWMYFEAGEGGKMVKGYLDSDGDGKADATFLSMDAMLARYPDICDIVATVKSSNF